MLTTRPTTDAATAAAAVAAAAGHCVSPKSRARRRGDARWGGTSQLGESRW